jgi:hypothetical protein
MRADGSEEGVRRLTVLPNVAASTLAGDLLRIRVPARRGTIGGMVKRSRVLMVMVVACSAAIGGVAAGAGTGAQFSWSKAVRIDRANRPILSIACPSPRKCIALDAGAREIAFDPATLRANMARTLRIGSQFAHYSLACASAGQCVLVSNAGYEETFAVASGRIVASARVATRQQCGVPTCGTTLVAPVMVAVACPGPHLCVAAARQGTYASFDPAKPRAAQRWPFYTLTDSHYSDLIALACPSRHQCTALDDEDDAVTFDSAAPHGANLTALGHGGDLDMLACATTSQCTALASRTGVTVRFDPGSQAPPAMTTIATTAALTRLVCPSAGLCIAVDEQGRALAANPQTDTAWTVTPIDGMNTVNDITCPSPSRCVAVDVRGHAAVATLPTH